MEKKQGAFRTTIGGQALIEGILMRGPEKDAIVVRSPEGLVTKVTERKFIRSKYPILGVPILRGAVTFISSMITGVKALMFSADYFPDEEDAQPGKFDQWLEKHIPAEKLQSLVVAFSVILSLALTLVLFMLLPTFIAGLFHAKSAAVHNIIEGVVKVAIFLGYLILCSKQKDVHRVFCYHGAEHKTIFCYEAGLPLTVENVRPQPKHHDHQLSVCGDHGVHSGIQPGVPLHQLAEHLGPHRRQAAAAGSRGGRDLRVQPLRGSP